jgi:hypothetical protein
MKLIERKRLRAKLMSLKGCFISVCGSRRRDNSRYNKKVCVIRQSGTRVSSSLLTVIEINENTLSFKSLALERVKFFAHRKDVYFIYDHKG